MSKNFSTRKTSGLKDLFKVSKHKDIHTDLNSNIAKSGVKQSEEDLKNDKFRRFSEINAKNKNKEDQRRSSLPWKHGEITNLSPPLKQLAKVFKREPEIIHNYKTFRILILGSSGVGKTSILQRFVTGDFGQSHVQTVSEVYETGIFLDYDNHLKQFDIEFRDFNGEFKNQYLDLYEQEIIEANACIVVYSRDIEESFDFAIEVIGDITNLKDDEAPILVVENKSDLKLTGSRILSNESFDIDNCIFETVSCKLNQNIEVPIHKIVRAIEDQS